jgi:hypothetical protein
VRGAVLEIDAQQLLLAADDAQLDGGRQLGILVQAGLEMRLTSPNQ